jgi:hypothetical protein
MTLTFDQAQRITDQRNAAMMASDLESFLRLWSNECTVEGPAHFLDSKEQLRAAISGAFSAMQALKMVTRSLAVQGDAMYYEFAVLWQVRSSGDRLLQTGMTYHQIDGDGLLLHCREYFDPTGTTRASAAERPEIASLLAELVD